MNELKKEREEFNKKKARIQMADQQYKDAFDDELKGFKERVQLRAREKLEEAVKEIEESLQKCFESRDLEMLKEVIATIPEEEARYHMKRCVDSGLWVPDAKAAEQGAQEASSETSGAE
ncbi:hypothetical protein V5799_005884 [Amblyomma americanum]|uniref:Cdc37 C-terminal domain-containing protein n=1 Tax=Amblyomma americanum TaxID=6943 RepID=A0AAQ4DY04_AMBAM